MPITIKEAKECILDDINKTYMDITDFEIREAIYDSEFKNWKIEGTFSYKITNRKNGIKFDYTITDTKRIESNRFKSQY